MESSAPVGSSARTMAGLVTMARAQAMRWRWPPDIWYGYFLSTSATSSMAATCSTRPGISLGPTRLIVSARAMFSSPVRVSRRLASWNTKPRRSRRKRERSFCLMLVTSWPSTTIWPDVGRSMVEMQLSSVDLPEPDVPMIAMNSPVRTSKLTPSSALVMAVLMPRPFEP